MILTNNLKWKYLHLEFKILRIIKWKCINFDQSFCIKCIESATKCFDASTTDPNECAESACPRQCNIRPFIDHIECGIRFGSNKCSSTHWYASGNIWENFPIHGIQRGVQHAIGKVQSEFEKKKIGEQLL